MGANQRPPEYRLDAYRVNGRPDHFRFVSHDQEDAERVRDAYKAAGFVVDVQVIGQPPIQAVLAEQEAA